MEFTKKHNGSFFLPLIIIGWTIGTCFLDSSLSFACFSKKTLDSGHPVIPNCALKEIDVGVRKSFVEMIFPFSRLFENFYIDSGNELNLFRQLAIRRCPSLLSSRVGFAHSFGFVLSKVFVLLVFLLLLILESSSFSVGAGKHFRDFCGKWLDLSICGKN